MPLDAASIRAQLPPLRALFTLDAARNALVTYVVLSQLVRTSVFVSSHGISGSVRALYESVSQVNPPSLTTYWNVANLRCSV